METLKDWVAKAVQGFAEEFSGGECVEFVLPDIRGPTLTDEDTARIAALVDELRLDPVPTICFASTQTDPPRSYAFFTYEGLSKALTRRTVAF